MTSVNLADCTISATLPAALVTKKNSSPKSSRTRALIDTQVVYCGDNLDQLAKLPEACVDLVYIDPPFNSNRNYEVFWYEKHEMRSFDDRHGSMQAYIDFMRPRCVELARVLRSTGTFYYHCDWHACHYVKVMLDQIFGEGGFINEIIWKRQSSHNDAKQGSKHLGRVHDTIFMYAKADDYYFKHLYRPYDPEYVEKFYRHVEHETGRRYQLGDLGAPGGAAPSKGNPHRRDDGPDAAPDRARVSSAGSGGRNGCTHSPRDGRPDTPPTTVAGWCACAAAVLRVGEQNRAADVDHLVAVPSRSRSETALLPTRSPTSPPATASSSLPL
jgi:hypothetical protein